jgi:hypothetical protein
MYTPIKLNLENLSFRGKKYISGTPKSDNEKWHLANCAFFLLWRQKCANYQLGLEKWLPGTASLGALISRNSSSRKKLLWWESSLIVGIRYVGNISTYILAIFLYIFNGTHSIKNCSQRRSSQLFMYVHNTLLYIHYMYMCR